MREPDNFPIISALIKRMTWDEVYGLADGILQHYDYDGYIGNGSNAEAMQERMAKAIIAFANDVEDREELV